MVSKLHIKKFKQARVTVKVSEFSDRGFLLVNHREKLAASHERVIDCGNVPAKYILIEVEKGSPVPARKDQIKVVGLNYQDID